MAIIKNISILNKHHSKYYSYKAIISTIRYGLNSVDPALLIQKKIKKDGNFVSISGNFPNEKTTSFNLNDFHDVYIIGAGKASGRMALGMSQIIQDKLSDGVVIVPYGQKITIPKIRIVEANHPFPDNNSVRGSKEILKLLYRKSVKSSLIFCLLSGGGSSLFSLPIDGINLIDKNFLIKALMEKGSPINEINIIRKHLSKIKGGKLILDLEKQSKKYKMISFILSDVIGDRIDTIASGPTVLDHSTYHDSIEILKRYDLWDNKNKHIIKIQKIFSEKAPSNIENDKRKFCNVENFLIGNNTLLCNNIQLFVNNEFIKNKKNVIWIKKPFNGEAQILADKTTDFFLKTIKTKKSKFFFIRGGETTVNLEKNDAHKQIGTGGRNQEMIFRLLDNLSKEDKLPKDFCIASIGSDGIDGNSQSAGGIITMASIELLRNKKIDSKKYLQNHNTSIGLKLVKSNIVTGLTGTNVNDIILGCCYY